MVRKSGELWISKTTPHTLKYTAGDPALTEYWVNSATTYIAGEDIKKGQVLVIKKSDVGASGRVYKASWPIDANDVIGVALNDANNTLEVRVLNYGYLEFTRAELLNLFPTQSDITVGNILASGNYYSAFGTTNDGGAGNGWDADLGTFSGNGAPLYWYQGRLIKTGASAYAMQQPTAKAGLLTTSTPAGYKYPDPNLLGWADESFNVNYNDLPIIGNIFEYTHDGTDVLSMIIHVNFSKFSRKTQFFYPASGLYNYEVINDPATIEIRHGLFTDSSILSHTDLAMLGSADGDIDGPIVKVYPGYNSSKVDSKTAVTIASDTAFYGKVIGEVSYIL